MLQSMISTGDVLLDTILLVAGSLVGYFFNRNKRNIKTIGILVQLALLLSKMARHYYDTHPDAKDRMDKGSRELLEKMWHKDLKAQEEPTLKNSKDTGAVG